MGNFSDFLKVYMLYILAIIAIPVVDSFVGFDTGDEGVLVAWNVIFASIAVFIAVCLKFRNLIGFPDFSLSQILLILPPLMYASFFLIYDTSTQSHGWRFLAITTANFLAVALVEELLFRGILLNVLSSYFSLRGVLVMGSTIFGMTHLLNTLHSEFSNAAVQSFAAILTGFFLCVIYLRTGSLWPPILLHFVWDLGLNLMNSTTGVSDDFSMSSGIASEASPTIFVLLGATALVFPNFLYGLWLSRKVQLLSLEVVPETGR
ncbi:CPBP family intramembrane metalloprotease [Paradonghicola geojensis]|nr:CPBP family intramembrane metalloprotease [Marivivens geojensis]